MLELQKKENQFYNNYYEGINEKKHKKVICILDDFCTRYIIIDISKPRTKILRRAEFKNDKKETCYNNALKQLNK